MQPATRVPSYVGGVVDPGDALAELVFGMILVIGITSSTRYGFVDPEPDRVEILVTALSVALAWGVIDGVFVLIASVYRQGRVRRVAKQIAARGEDALRDTGLRRELEYLVGGSTWDVFTVEGHAEVVRAAAAQISHQRIRLVGEDWRAAGIIAAITAGTMLPTIAPFFFPIEPGILIWISNALAVLTLYFAGLFFAKWTDYPRWAWGLITAAVGVALVALTVLLDAT